MKQQKLGSWLGIALALATVGIGAEASAGNPTKDKPSAEAPSLPTPITLSPEKLTFGMSPKEVGVVYESVIDADHLKELQDSQPGVQMDTLLAQIAEYKRIFKRSLLEFSKINSKWDSTALAGEYTYDNKEAMMLYSYKGKTRYFFFIRDKLYKVVDEIKLSDKSRYGADFKAATDILNKRLGIEGRVRPSDPAQGRTHQEVDWRDANTHLRAMEWGDGKLGLAYEDNATLANLATLRAPAVKATP